MLPPIAITMTGIFFTILAILFGISQFLDIKSEGNWLPTVNNLAKRQYEIFAVVYAIVWICVFGFVVVFELWRSFTAVRINNEELFSHFLYSSDVYVTFVTVALLDIVCWTGSTLSTPTFSVSFPCREMRATLLSILL